MKFRTDFVTNSSSSSFILDITVNLANGDSINAIFDPSGSSDVSEASFDKQEFISVIVPALQAIEDLNAIEFALTGTQFEGRSKRIEMAEDNSPVQIVLKPLQKGQPPVVEVWNGEGTLGHLPLHASRKVATLILDYGLELGGTLVKKLSYQSKRAGPPPSHAAGIKFQLKNKADGTVLVNKFLSVESFSRHLVDSIDPGINYPKTYEYGEYRELLEKLKAYEDHELDLSSVEIIKTESRIEEIEYDCINDFDEERDNNSPIAIDKDRARYYKKLNGSIRSVKDIKSIAISREYNAWGEWADLVADNDRQLLELAEALLASEGADRVIARQKMLDYINTPTTRTDNNFSFARGFAEVAYNWSGEPEKLDRLAQRLCSSQGPGSVSGTEDIWINMQGGEYTESASFDLW